MRNVSLPTLAPLLRTLPLQEMPRHLHVWLAADLYNKVSVLIGLGDNTHCMPHDCAKATLQQLADDNAAYALALIDGNDLSLWHDRPAWKAKAAVAKTNPVTVYSARQRAVVRMALGVLQTARYSNGQDVLRGVKNKDVMFSQSELEANIASLIKAQEGLCALTGIEFQFDGECNDKELLCSLDRIDSDGHYEAGNLQVVCRFANRWKSDSLDGEFRRLIAVVRSS